MEFTYPHTIENCMGEKLIFKQVQPEPDGDRVIVENLVAPGSGPPVLTHWLQDECLTVVNGKIGYQVEGKEEQYAGVGETVLFERGTPHRFWNAGEGPLKCTCWIKPADSIVFFLSAIYDAQNKAGGARPEAFDSAYLMTQYAGEYDMAEIPAFVKKTIIPMTYQLGRILGKYRKFRNAPKPLKREANRLLKATGLAAS